MAEDVKKIAEELVIACKRAYTRGIQTGSGGNVSARILGKDLMLVKASGSSFADSTPEGFVITDFDGNLVEGDGKPTREALLHGLIYRMCPDVNAVVHTHSPYSIAWAVTGKALPRNTWHSRLKMNADLPTLDVKAAMVRREDFPLVEEIYKENPDLPGFLLKDHGLVAVGKDAIAAEHTAELIEETAQVAILKAAVLKLGL
ncbi:class II aldolase/adducin family protein [Faecalicatena fissicatena]|uniref:Class II aldolase/adducin family protein n=1 Tax=Faecalicatena fissicatena TaxID=290055 RepID=A0ABS2EBY1_9FIRM|nr:class II aldolase/adducin family protein [Faecalicatena fissicatena]MBM6739086.1 class II aldolase/adducin family protein [Faecalicatena fissicatena]